MVEVTNTEGRGYEFVRVKAGNVTPEAKFDSIVVSDVVDVVATVTEKKEELARSLEEISVPVNGSVERTYTLAKGFVARIYKNHHPELPNLPAEPSLLVINRLDLDSVTKEFLLDVDPETTGAFIVSGLNNIYVLSDTELPAYMTAGEIAHEWLHLLFDTNMGVYSVESGNLFSSEHRRKGLEVYKLSRREGRVVSSEKTGEILSELANYAYEALFNEEILSSPEGMEMFAEEINQRRALIDKEVYMEEGQIGLRFGDKLINISEGNIHYSKTGDLIISGAIIASEIMGYLDHMVGEIEGKLLSELLLDAKSDPSLQPQIQRELDRVMGKGFYNRLKREQLTFDNLLAILVDIQDKYEESALVVQK